MWNVQKVMLIFALLSVFSCSLNKLVGSWEFIELYEGVIPKIDTLKNKQNRSRYGNGILSFHKNNSFSSKELTGGYLHQNNLLKIKYADDKDTTQMKISYISKDHLLLSSLSGKPTAWFYKKVKYQK